MQTLRSGWGSGSSYGGGGYGSSGSGAYGSGTRGGTGARSAPRRSNENPPDALPRTGAKFAGVSPQSDIPALAIGDRVTHDSYGLGTVVALEGSGSSSVAKIDFGSSGTKRLLLRYSPVTKL